MTTAADRTVATTVYDDLPDGVLVADADGRVIVLNEPGARLLGTDPVAAVGRDYREVLPLRDLSGRDWWECTEPYRGLNIRRGQPERQLILGTGPALLVTARYVRESGRVARLVVAFRGTTARTRLERSSADLVSTVAHELRSPLTSVKGFTATLLAKWDRFTDAQKRHMLETVNADADRVTRLIKELLDVSRIDAGRLEVHRQVVDLEPLIRRCFAGRVAAGDPAERFVLEVVGALPELWADRDKLDQVMGNLVENAIRHGEGVVTVTVAPDGDGIAVTVVDQGAGIAPEVEARLFARFWKGGPRGGTGLGLYITKGLVVAHGGSVEHGSGPDGGALFRVRLPAGTPSFAHPD